MKTVAFVPIKLNSQRLPHKNLLPIAGHPLCWHICNTLIKVKEIDEVYVYCSDEKVKEYLPKECKLKLRDPALDGDFVKGFDIYNKFIQEIDADIYVLAHTTSPFVRKESITNALNKVQKEEYDSAFSARKIQTFAWYQGKPINYKLEDVPRTQDLDPIFVETSGFFIFEREVFVKHHRRIGYQPYIQEVSEIEAIDIDEKEDYEFALKISKGESEI